MTATIKIITTPLAFNISVNCYLVETDEGYVLIDTGMPNQRREIEQELERAGCHPGTLKLIILTHGDSDHCGNAAYLRQKFGATIAMHYDDSGMVERGDMSWNRQNSHNLIGILFGLFFSLSKSDRFKPDLYVEDKYSLSDYGFDAEVLHIPGHSKGSIGILTASPVINNLLVNIPIQGLKGIEVAAFDTRFSMSDIESPVLRILVRLFGYAAKPMANRLKKKGGELIVPPEGFLVNGTEGPLKEGELERAADWVKQILATQESWQEVEDTEII